MGPSGPPRVHGRRVCEKGRRGVPETFRDRTRLLREAKSCSIMGDQLHSPLPHPSCLRDISISSLPSLRASRDLAMEKKSSSSEYSPGNPGNREACLFLSDDLSLLPVSIPVHNWDLDLPERDNSLQSFSRGCGSLNRPGHFLQFRAALINQSLHSEYNNILDSSEKGSEGRTPVRSLVKNVKDKGRRFADKIRGHGFP